jgi:hypothetical protein
MKHARFLTYLSITNFFPLAASLHVGIHFGFSLATSTTTPNKPITKTSINSVESIFMTQIPISHSKYEL